MAYNHWLKRIRLSTIYYSRRKSKYGARVGKDPAVVSLQAGPRDRGRRRRSSLFQFLLLGVPGLLVGYAAWFGSVHTAFRIRDTLPLLIVLPLSLVLAVRAWTATDAPPAVRWTSFLAALSGPAILLLFELGLLG